MSKRTLRSGAFVFGCSTLMLILAACMSERPADVPTNAITGASGNDRLTYTVPSDGSIWVYDTNRDKIVYSGSVVKSDSVVVDPSSNVVTIGGRTVADKSLYGGDRNVIFFQPSSAAPHRDTSGYTGNEY